MTDSTDTRMDHFRCRFVQGIGSALARPTFTAHFSIICGDPSVDEPAECDVGRLIAPAAYKRLDGTKTRMALQRLSLIAFVGGSLDAARFGSTALDGRFNPSVIVQKAPAHANAAPCAGFESRRCTAGITFSDTDGTSAFSNNHKLQHA